MMFELRLPSKECDLGPSVEYLGWKLQLGGHRCLRLQGKGGKNMETHGIDGGIMAESCVFRCFNLRAIDDVQPCLASKLCGIWWNHQLFMALVSEKRHNKSWHVTGDQTTSAFNPPACLVVSPSSSKSSSKPVTWTSWTSCQGEKSKSFPVSTQQKEHSPRTPS